ncbi:uncharacterized protein L3040_005933 [Drepanopeziza brunnea f. sp. 'multigermtubi']|uniref:Dihydrofolate reductase n=1 Tax=Marssonina brunnea f. sp. multigermtubi (strain MB_m1) TaxID=1072389 RepID=K1WGG3_MARBU|nr:dihydrofolate reductase [Drepanopeziza brunnea f. sp. 'multigermtubi' MB_m1]EKD11961.1 dihydrofolate reductase [Drepanopeziza brunnea f. sp. 'multigermtubi' MB_m1]KAJ5040274.1 hypothetical protein L3040_005933 [Drepanopeziza brunnea f. sp. 'multigermtubi']
MSSKTDGEAAAAAASRPGPRKLKILMLHGYTQSGPSFHAKTRALEKALVKAFPPPPPAPHKSPASSLRNYPGGIQLIYPTGPIRLHPADIPGSDPSVLQSSTTSTISTANGQSDGRGEEDEDGPDAWGWWKKADAPDETYVGLERGLEVVRETILAAGGVDGVIGFSQGGAFAGLVASLLEPARSSSFPSPSPLPTSTTTPPFAYPAAWTALNHPPLKFAVSYSGFYAQAEQYRGFYEPKIATRFLHVIGSLDSVVEEARSEGFVERCADALRVVHPGGHFVPVGKEWVGVLVGFLRDVLARDEQEDDGDACGEKGGVEDMDVPF